LSANDRQIVIGPVTGTDASLSTRKAKTGMKTMTCGQLGGPCDLKLQGETADDVIKAQDRHLRDAVKAGDIAHEGALRDMKGRWRHPIASMGWYRDAKKTFGELPED
jgi:predicted small metal-binding protein